jgi:hypothetical protein
LRRTHFPACAGGGASHGWRGLMGRPGTGRVGTPPGAKGGVRWAPRSPHASPGTRGVRARRTGPTAASPQGPTPARASRPGSHPKCSWRHRARFRPTDAHIAGSPTDCPPHPVGPGTSGDGQQRLPVFLGAIAERLRQRRPCPSHLLRVVIGESRQLGGEEARDRPRASPAPPGAHR